MTYGVSSYVHLFGSLLDVYTREGVLAYEFENLVLFFEICFDESLNSLLSSRLMVNVLCEVLFVGIHGYFHVRFNAGITTFQVKGHGLVKVRFYQGVHYTVPETTLTCI